MTAQWDGHVKAERDGGTCPDCGDVFPAPPVSEAAERTVESMIRKNLKDRSEKIATDLERMAKSVRFDCSKFDQIGSPGIATYTGVVGDIMHTLNWGVANLNSGGLLHESVQADLDRALRAAGVPQS